MGILYNHCSSCRFAKFTEDNKIVCTCFASYYLNCVIDNNFDDYCSCYIEKDKFDEE